MTNKKEKLKFLEWKQSFISENKDVFQNKLDNQCCDDLIETWTKAASKFGSESQNNCCDRTLESLLHFFLEKMTQKNYIVRKNAMFGDLVEIRTEGFERRYIYNVKIMKTYKKAYEKTEEEYQNNFGKRRYSSYDSFRQVRKKTGVGK
tara:strand:- start:41 stop:484 length:444 start_codon:yes stop_codon:yes gene_type:complete